MKLRAVICLTLIIVWFPLSVPLVIIGIFARLAMASLCYGYEITDTFLQWVSRAEGRK